MKILILSVLLLTMAYISDAQNVNIPDANFKNALISVGVDANFDGEISYVEAEAITSLIVGERSISDMTGIEAFINLELLLCSSNPLTSLDISNNTAIKELYCNDNQLTSLDISNNSVLKQLCCNDNQLSSLDVTNNFALKQLICSENPLTSLDVTNNTALKELDCSDNQLSSLDVTNNSDLHYIYCSNNQLTNLDVSNNTVLIDIFCSNNQLTSLDVSNNTALGLLSCEFNSLTSLDVSKNTALWLLNCSNNQLTSLDITNNILALFQLDCSDNLLTSLDVSKNAVLAVLFCGSNRLTNLDISKNEQLIYYTEPNGFTGFLDISYMPTLHEVCVWEIPFPPADKVKLVDTTGSPNVYFTTDCLTKSQEYYNDEKAIDIYPNPTDGIINIEIENNNNAIIEIYTFSGTLIFSKVLYSEFKKNDISGFSEGVYIVKVKQDSNVVVEKVVVK